MNTKTSITPSETESSNPISTECFAANNFVKPQSVRARLCRYGSYFGVRPKKLQNGRLVWPDVQVQA
jgi:hypothetical protein